MDQLTFTTRQAARYLGVEPHVLQSNYQRHGNYAGMVPRKGRAGRLVWSAADVREAALPALEEQPNGAALLVEWLAAVCPGVEQKDAHRIAYGSLGSEALPGWQPLPGQSADVVVRSELPLALLSLQAVLDRLDSLAGNRPLSQGTREFAAVLTRRLSCLTTEPREVT